MTDFNSEANLQAASMRLQSWAEQDGEVSRLDAARELAALWKQLVRKDATVGHKALAGILLEEYAA